MGFFQDVYRSEPGYIQCRVSAGTKHGNKKCKSVKNPDIKALKKIHFKGSCEHIGEKGKNDCACENASQNNSEQTN